MKYPSVIRIALIAACPAWMPAAGTPQAGASAPSARAPWLTELSASSRVGYDSNLRGVANAQPDAPIADHGVLTSSLGVKLLVSLSVMREAPKDYLQVGYAPVGHWFRGDRDENHVQHRFMLLSAGKLGAWSWSVDSMTTLIDGSKDSPRVSTYNIFGMGMVRDRRAQTQEAGRAWLRYDAERLFVRGTASVLVHDFHTDLRAPSEAEAGRLNWLDRGDCNGGFDVGWKAGTATSVSLGGRFGRQHQDAAAWLPKSSSNHYARALVGLEGRPTKWLSCSLVGGPDFRRYALATQCLTDRTPVAWYHAGSATAKLGPTDSLTLAARQERWLSSTGQSAYDARSASLAWEHGFNQDLSVRLAAQLQQGKYPAPIVRDDVMVGGNAQLRWRVTKEIAVTLDVGIQAGSDRLDLPATTGRGFHRTTGGLGLQYTR